MKRISHRGSILVSTLWILSILSVVALGMNYRMGMELRLSRYAWDELRAFSLAQGGIAYAVSVLKEDIDSVDGLSQCGVTVLAGQPVDVAWRQTLDTGRFVIGSRWSGRWVDGILDEDGKINLNTASETVLLKLLQSAGGVALSADALPIVHAILDWRDEDSARSYLDGAEDAYYRNLDFPYPCANRPFRSVEELRWVRGVTQDLYSRLEPLVTVFGDPDALRLNLNTASVPVLQVLAESAGFDRSQAVWLAEQIDLARGGNDRVSGTADDQVWSDDDVSSLEKKIGGLLLTTDARWMSAFKMFFRGHSTYYRIEAEGILDSGIIKKKLVAIVHKDKDKLRFVHFFED